MKQQIGAAYNLVLRPKQQLDKTSSNESSRSEADGNNQNIRKNVTIVVVVISDAFTSRVLADEDEEEDARELERKLRHVRTMRDQRLSMRSATIYAPAMIKRHQTGKSGRKLFNCAFIVGLKPIETDSTSREQEPVILDTVPKGVSHQLPTQLLQLHVMI